MAVDADDTLATQGSRARILIVDDHALVRTGLAQLIGEENDLEVCGEAETVSEAYAYLDNEPPDLAVVDLTLETGSGMDILRRIKAGGIETKTIVLSMHQEALFAERALHAGAMGYINKRSANREIIDAIRQVLAGKTYLSPYMMDRIRDRIGQRRTEPAAGSIQSLSDRELEVFRLIAEGHETRAIAQELNVSVRTVDTHKERIKAKLGLRSAAELTRRAVLWESDGFSE